MRQHLGRRGGITRARGAIKPETRDAKILKTDRGNGQKVEGSRGEVGWGRWGRKDVPVEGINH